MSRIVFAEISKDKLKPLITLAFQDDAELLSRYSLLNKPTLEESVNKNYETILEHIEDPVYSFGRSVEMFRVEQWDGLNVQPIGFTVIIRNEGDMHELCSFGINIYHRNCKTNAKWLQGVKDMLGKFFYVPLHVNNQRAIDYFARNGFTLKTNKIENVVYLYSNYNDFIKKRSKQLIYGS